MPVAFVLSGGGAKGAFEVGVLKYLYEVRNVRPDIVCGTSVGALNALKLAEGPEVFPELESIWREISGKHDICVRNPKLVAALEQLEDNAPGLVVLGGLEHFGLSPFPFDLVDYVGDLFRDVESYYVTDPLRELVRNRINVDRVSGSGIRLRMTTVDLCTGIMYYVDERGEARPSEESQSLFEGFKSLGDAWNGQLQPHNLREIDEMYASAVPRSLELAADPLSPEGRTSPRRVTRRIQVQKPDPISLGLIEGVIASASIPVAFNPVIVGDRKFVDGGIRELAPVKAALELGATELYVILATSRQIPSLPQEHPDDSAEILSNARRTIDILLHEITGKDLQVESNAQVEVLSPQWGIQDTLDFGRHVIALNIWYGYETARYKSTGGSNPTTLCLYGLKLMANKLDRIDFYERHRQEWQRLANRRIEEAEEYEQLGNHHAAEQKRRTAEALQKAAESLEKNSERLRQEVAAMQESLDGAGCPQVPGVNMPLVDFDDLITGPQMPRFP